MQVDKPGQKNRKELTGREQKEKKRHGLVKTKLCVSNDASYTMQVRLGVTGDAMPQHFHDHLNHRQITFKISEAILTYNILVY